MGVERHKQVKDMTIQGRIYQVFPIVKGTKRDGGEWRKQDFIVEFFDGNDRFADRVLLSALNDRIEEYDLHEGDDVKVLIGHSTNLYNGRTYNEIKCYKVEKIRNAPQIEPAVETSASQPSVAPQAETKAEEGDDLPF